MNQEGPAAFTEYIFERHPGKAVLVFALANSQGGVTERLHAIRARLEAAGKLRDVEGLPPMPSPKEERPEDKARRQQAKLDRSEILLAEHIISNAIWLKENDFADRFQQALPEAQEELKKLVEHDQWWARLYVAEIMRRHSELRSSDVLEALSQDPNALVSKTAKEAQQRVD
jgi:hypothetical protein